MPLPRSVFDDYYRYAGVGLQFAATLAVFALVGWWGDGKLGTSPWLLLIGVFAGFGLGFYSLVSKFGNTGSQRAPRPKDPPDQA
jgi:F0F1-type ATP synthase assembly protein I